MTGQEKDKDRLFWILCARALQRHDEGFPSTEQEIQDFESSYVPSEEEKARFKELLPRILTHVRDCGDSEPEKLAEHTPSIESSQTPWDKTRERRTNALSAAARAADIKGLPPDLLEKIERIIEESEEPTDEEETKAGNDTQDGNRER